MKIGDVWYRQERRSCGKKCGKCPHGPFWYAYWRTQGRLKSKYIGKELPPDVEALMKEQFPVETPMTEEEKAYLALGGMQGMTFSAMRKLYRGNMVKLTALWNQEQENCRKAELLEEIADLRRAWKLLFPGRR